MGFNYGKCPQCGHDGDVKVHTTTDRNTSQVWLNHLCQGCGHVFVRSTHEDPQSILHWISYGFWRIVAEIGILIIAYILLIPLAAIFSLFVHNENMSMLLSLFVIGSLYLLRILKGLSRTRI